MRRITYNQYKILNLREHDFSYKLVETNLPFIKGQEKLNRQNLEKLMFKVAGMIKGPVASIFKDGKTFLAIPSDRFFKPTKVQLISFEVSVSVKNEIYQLHGRDIDKSNCDIPLKFLNAAIKRQLKQHYQFFELNNSNQFYIKTPVFHDDSSGIDIYEGFFLKLRQFDDGNFYLVLNPTFKYVHSKFLSQLIDLKNREIMLDNFIDKHCLYHNGDDWYIIEIVGFLNTIGQDTYSGSKIIDYINNRTSNHIFKTNRLMKPTDLTLLYKYPGRSMTPHHGAASLAKLVFHTKDLDNTALHKYSIQPVEERFERIAKAIGQFLQTMTLNGKSLKISTNPFEESLRYFPVPDLLFNGGKVLSIRNASFNSEKTALRDYPKERKNHIIDNQVLKQTAFDAQYLIYPESLDKSFVDAVKSYTENYLKKLAPKFQGFQLIPYKINGSQSATFQTQEIEKTLQKHNATSGFALFLFDDLKSPGKRKIEAFHDCLKKKFFPNLKFQCASSRNLRWYFEQVTDTVKGIVYKPMPKVIDKFKSYLFYLVMEYLKINNKWAYALAKNPNYDVWIGVDVQDRYVGLTFFYRNGENIVFRYREIPRKTGKLRDEKIPANIIREVIMQNLETQIPLFVPNPNGVVLLRDGRSFDEEVTAFENTLKELKNKGIITNPNFKWGVVELHKKTALPLRAACRSTGFAGLENPQAGAYRIIGGVEAFLFNTGYPFRVPGTVNPIVLFKSAGNLDFEKAVQDIFGQCMLAFSAPDRSNNLPITIKLIDSFLEPLSDTIETGDDEQLESVNSEDENNN